MVKEDPVGELSLTPSYGKNPIIVGLVESLDLVARRDREGDYLEIFRNLGLDSKTWEGKHRRMESYAKGSVTNNV